MIHARISRAIPLGVILVTLTCGATALGQGVGPDPQGARIAIRSGDHSGFGRIVIDTTSEAAYQIDQDGDHVALRFAGDITLADPPVPPRNVTGMTTNGAVFNLTLKHGVRLQPMRLDGRVVLDILDAAENDAMPARARPGNNRSPEPQTPSARPGGALPDPGGRSAPDKAAGASAPMTAERPAVAAQTLPPPEAAPVQAGPSSTAPAQAVLVPQAIEAAQQAPPGRDVLPENEGPLMLLARRVKLPPGVEGSAFLVPFDSTTGAASFSRGDSTYVVFDERRAVDMSALRSDALFSAASVKLLPNGTLFRIPMAAARSLALTQMPRGWRIAALSATPKKQPIGVSLADGRLSFATEQSGDVVNLADPETGATLLVGTQRRPGQGLAATRHSTEFILRPTIQGVVIEALSDSIKLKQVPTGFMLEGGPNGLLLSPPTPVTDQLMDAALLTRRLDFSTIPAEALIRQSVREFDDAAASPPLARGPKNHAVAATLISLGLGAEAEGLLHMAAVEDPKEAGSADTGALTAIAALLAGRTEDAGALADPRLDGTDEIALWRAVRTAMLDDGSPSAATVFAATAPLVFLYPPPIRDHILPLIAETMIKGGEIDSAARLLAAVKSDPRLAYARALMKQAEGETGDALTMLDALAAGHDQFDRARAAVRAVELRLSSGALDSTQAADALDKLLYVWRGDSRELVMRERVAELRGQSGAWRVALATLRQAEVDFPDQSTAIHQRLKDMFAGMVRDQTDQKLPPIEFVAMMDENADLLADFRDDEAVQQPLADRLLALDLPDRARPVLEKLMRAAKTETAKARFGTSLATLAFRDGDDAALRSALDASEGHDLPAEIVEQRLIIKAQSAARQGDAAAATAMLAPLKSAPAIEARAQILETASDWPAAEQAWSDCVAVTVPDSGALDENQTRMVLRLATATARANDDAGLAGLRAKYAGRIGANPLGDMFRMLTVEPIRDTSDIKRSQQEVSLAASLPADLKALRPGTSPR